jgi:hypothetical protein
VSNSQYDLPLLDFPEATPICAASPSRVETSTYVRSAGLRTTVTIKVYASAPSVNLYANETELSLDYREK